MPNWNFKDDWPNEFLPLDQNGNSMPLVSMPVAQNLATKDQYILRIEREPGNRNIVKLFIEISGVSNIPVLAMCPGYVSNIQDDNIILDFYFLFSLPQVNKIIRRANELLYEEAVEGSELTVFPISWYINWINADRIPEKITYENVTPFSMDVGQEVRVGDRIGTAKTNSFRVKIEYKDSTSIDPKCIHPREFFSLLFWQEAYDPVIQERSFADLVAASPPAPDSPYSHPLIQKMMEVKEDGTSGNWDDADDTYYFLEDDTYGNWLGLRSPLRTYKRAEWEARKELLLHHLPSGTNWTSAGNAYSLKKNPLVEAGAPAGASKCNVFAGEMAFRAGFRPHIARYNNTSLSYPNTTWLTRNFHCQNSSNNDETVSPSGEITRGGNQYGLSQPFGKKRYVPPDNQNLIDNINNEITIGGKLILHSRKRFNLRGDWKEGHVIAIKTIPRIQNAFAYNLSDTEYFDQNRWVIPRTGTPSLVLPATCNEGWCGCDNPPSTSRAFIELLPGGDPTEEWGILSLNCLERI